MKSHQPCRPYSYHFLKIIDKPERSPLNLDPQDPIKNNNKNLSFRYFAQCPDKEKRITSPQPDLNNFNVISDRTTQPIKKYTFSTFRKSQDTELVRNAYSPQYPLNFNKTCQNNQERKINVENGQQTAPRYILKRQSNKQLQGEISSLKRNKEILQQKIQTTINQNQLLRVRSEQYKKRNLDQQVQLYKLKIFNVEQQNQIKKLNKSLKDAQQIISNLQGALTYLQQQNDIKQRDLSQAKLLLQQLSRVKQTISLDSKVLNLTLQLSQPYSQRKQTQQSEQSGQNLIISFQQQYKQIAFLLGISTSIDNLHEQLIKEIVRGKQAVQQNTLQKALIIQFDKQRAMLIHYLKKSQAELSKTYSLNTILNSQVAKSSRLIEDCNEEINRLHIKQIQSKMREKMAYI